MKILITGGHGQLAHELTQLASDRQQSIFAPGRDKLDITKKESILTVTDCFKPDVIINTAAYTQVDRAETETAEAFATNEEGAKNLAMICEKIKCPLLHVSTDYIFDGNSHLPYVESDAAAPLSVYGHSKLAGEQAVIQHCEKYIILRVSGVFGFKGNNFVKTMLRLARQNKPMRIIDDQITCPTPAYAIAETLLQLVTGSLWGVYHYCGDTIMSWYDFANRILLTAGLSAIIEPIKAVAYQSAAKRPAYSVLNCDKLRTHWGIERPNLELGLTHVINQLSAS